MCLDGVCGTKPSIHTTQRVKNLTAERFVRSHSEASPVSQKVNNAETQLQLEAVTGGSQPSSLPSVSLTSTEAQQRCRASEEIYLHSWFVPLSDTRQEEVYWNREEESAQWNRREKMKVSWDKDIQGEGKT